MVEGAFLAFYQKSRWDARAVEWACLENRCARKGTEGSNPSPTAMNVWSQDHRGFESHPFRQNLLF